MSIIQAENVSSKRIYLPNIDLNSFQKTKIQKKKKKKKKKKNKFAVSYPNICQFLSGFVKYYVHNNYYAKI